MKTLPEMYIWQRKSPLNFRTYPDLDLDVGIFFNEFVPLWHRGNSANVADNSRSCRQIFV